MGNLVDLLSQLLQTHPNLGYLFIGGSMLIQGEIAVFLLVYLVVTDVLTWWEYILSALITLILVEVCIFWIGRLLRNTRFGWKFYRKKKANRRIQLYSYYLKKNIGKLFIIAKFLPATSLVALLLTGWSRVRFPKFIKAYLSSLLLWFTSMTLLAYFFMSGLSYLKSQKIFRSVEVGIILIVAIVILGEYFFRKLINKNIQIEKTAKEVGDAVEQEIKTQTEKRTDVVSSEGESTKEFFEKTKNPREDTL